MMCHTFTPLLILRTFTPLLLLISITGKRQSKTCDKNGLKIFKFYEHPEISAQIEVMKTEVKEGQQGEGH